VVRQAKTLGRNSALARVISTPLAAIARLARRTSGVGDRVFVLDQPSDRILSKRQSSHTFTAALGATIWLPSAPSTCAHLQLGGPRHIMAHPMAAMIGTADHHSWV
jgi:hypothetical protein